MNETMKQLAEAVVALNSRTWVDYLLVIMPVIISVIAIVISIITANQQNKIALFEKRFECVSLLSFIMTVCESVIKYDGEDREIPLQSGMTTFYKLNGNEEQRKEEEYSAFYSGVLLKLSRLGCLFKGENIDLVMEFLSEFGNYISKVHRNDSTDTELQRLEELLIRIEAKKIANELDKYLKL